MNVPGYAPGLYAPGHAPGLGAAAEPSRGARMPVATVQDLLATALDAPTGKRHLDVPTGTAAPERGD